jgi:hypothetical protein
MKSRRRAYPSAVHHKFALGGRAGKLAEASGRVASTELACSPNYCGDLWKDHGEDHSRDRYDALGLASR